MCSFLAPATDYVFLLTRLSTQFCVWVNSCKFITAVVTWMCAAVFHGC